MRDAISWLVPALTWSIAASRNVQHSQPSELRSAGPQYFQHQHRGHDQQPGEGYAGSAVRRTVRFLRVGQAVSPAGSREHLRRVAVGTTVARRPPHSPVLALLTHTVLTLDLGIFGVETHSRIRLQDLDRRQEA